MTRGIIISESEKREILSMYHLGTENHIEEQGVVGGTVRGAVRGLGRLLRFGAGTADEAAKAAEKAAAKNVGYADNVVTAGNKARAAANARIAGTSSTASQYRNAAMRGFSKAGSPAIRGIYSNIAKREWRQVARYLMGGALRPGVFKELRLTFGLGPAVMAWGAALLKQYIVIGLCITAIRTILSAIENLGLTSISQINRYFNIPEYKDFSNNWLMDFLGNFFFESSYFPSVKVLFRGAVWLPSLIMNIKGILSYVNGIFNSIFNKNNEESLVEALTAVDKYFGEKKDELDEKTSELPSELLSSAPRDLVGKIKVDENGVYIHSPEYEIQKIGSVFAINIPNGGWYDLNDVEMLDVPTPKEGSSPLNINSEEGDSESGGFASKITQRLGGFNPKYSIDVEKFSKITRDPKFESKLQDAKNDASSNEESARVVDHLGVYNDPEKGMRLALAGRLKGGSENYYFDVVKQGSEWGWIDVEENNKWKPFEEY